jgi:hypothetical protein
MSYNVFIVHLLSSTIKHLNKKTLFFSKGKKYYKVKVTAF